MVGWQRTITSVGETWWESSSVGKILGPCLFPLQPEKYDKLDLIFFFDRLHLLHIGVFLLRPGGKGLQTSGSRVGVGRPSLRRLAFPEIRPVWRRVAERRQRAVSHQQPQGALRRNPRGGGALVWVPEQDDASLRGLLLQVAQNGNKQKTDALLTSRQRCESRPRIHDSVYYSLIHQWAGKPQIWSYSRSYYTVIFNLFK